MTSVIAKLATKEILSKFFGIFFTKKKKNELRLVIERGSPSFLR